MPSSLGTTLLAFAVALGVLIVVHELGHYLVARWVGIKVLRFSVGFGRPLLTRRFGADGTEWSLAAFPLGGYVKMLDEREGAVAPEELHRAFNRQSVGRRALVVVAGPLANFLLAIVLYTLLFMTGVTELKPLLGTPPANTPASVAGIEGGELVRSVSGHPVVTMSEMRWELIHAILDGRSADLEVQDAHGNISVRRLDTSSIDPEQLESDFFRRLGLTLHAPSIRPIIGQIKPDSVAARGGVRSGDEVIAIDGQAISTWGDIVAVVRSSPGRSLRFDIRRDAAMTSIELVPEIETEEGQRIGRIGVGYADDPKARAAMMAVLRLGPLESVRRAVTQTWETSIFSLRMIGRMATGQLSWKNLSGPVTIADYAGQSARMGLEPYLKFLALISISLGVLNLLPIPVLDGGHLLYYFVESIKGGPLSERIMEIGQQIGLGLLILLMAFAFYNDINRLVSG